MGPEAAAAEEHLDGLRLLEALRLGVVPAGHVERYTVGREGVLTALREDLDGSTGRLRVVMGDYGSGKSHLVEWIRAQALARGWLVGRATLDDRDVSPAQPKRVYHALASSLAYPARDGRDLGLGPLLETLAATGRYPRERSDPAHHRYLDAVLAHLNRLDPVADRDLRRDLVDWVEGHPAGLNVDWNRTLAGWGRGRYLLSLPDYRTFSNIYTYMLGGIAAMAREAGFRGLVVLIDEAEFYEVLGRGAREFADTLIACLAVAALGPGGVLLDTSLLPRGGQAVHRSLPLVYRPDQPLVVVLFLTPVRRGLEALCRVLDLARHRMDLADLTPDDYRLLYDRVTEIYRVSHLGFDLRPDLARPMGDLLYASVRVGLLPHPRAALKLVVEFLDLVRLAPGRVLEWLAQVGERLEGAGEP